MKNFIVLVVALAVCIFVPMGFIHVINSSNEPSFNVEETVENKEVEEVEEGEPKILPPEEGHVSDVLAQGGLTDEHLHPQWGANVLVYKLHDDRDKTSNVYIYEFTPYGNPNLRCATSGNGDKITCFELVEREKVVDAD